MRRVIDTAVNLLLVIGLAYVCFRPGGLVREPVERWRAHHETMDLVRENWDSLIADGIRFGNVADDANVVVVFSDYQCPFCRQAHANVERLLADYPGLSVVYRHLPLTKVHPLAEPAAWASICAQSDVEGSQALHRHLFETDDWTRDRQPDWVALAETVGLPNAEAMDRCMTNDDTRRRLSADIEFARQLGIRVTPTFLTRERFVRGVGGYAQFVEALGLELKESLADNR